MTWETVIGLEIHSQLRTQSKIFSAPQLHLALKQILKLVL